MLILPHAASRYSVLSRLCSLAKVSLEGLMRSLPLSVKEYLILQNVNPCRSGDMCVLRSLMKSPSA